MNRKLRRAQAKAGAAPAPLAPRRPAMFDEALRHYQAGRSAEAEHLCRQILSADSRHADALNLLGLIFLRAGRHGDAAEAIGEAIRINGAQPFFHANLGLALKALGRLDEALVAYGTAIRLKPDFAEAYSGLGNALIALRRPDDAVAFYATAIQIKPDYPEAYSNMGCALMDLGRLEEAAAAHASALRVRPDYAEAHSNLGNALTELGRFDEAISAYGAAIRIRPDFAEAHYNLGNALKKLDRRDEAVSAYGAAIRAKPDHARAYSNLGCVLTDLGRLDEAVAAFDTAIRLKPDYAEAYFNLGAALTEFGMLGEVMTAYDTAIRLKPDYADAYSNRLMTMHYQEDVGGDAILAEARRFAARIEDGLAPASFANPADPDRRLRIGYVSADFRHHPVGYFLEPVLARHDRENAEIFCYGNSPVADDMTDRLRGAADHWRDLANLSDEAAAKAVAADGIDILVDLSGHTARNRLGMFARKPAPVQVTWLGYFGTTGLTAMDFILADRFVVPDGAAADFTESVWRLPDSYLCFPRPDLDVPVLPPPAAGRGAVTFGNFNNLTKTSPAAIELWSRILTRMPGSKLLLKTRGLDDAQARRRVSDRFARHGVGPERLALEGASPRAELLASYNRVDVALDPTPYGGGTTTAEALWMGVPVVTQRGRTWVGRVGESILSAVGLPELVAAGPEEYVEAAIGLANDPKRLATLRAGLRARFEASAFCDGDRFVGNLDRAYRGMWRRWCAVQARGKVFEP